MTKKNEDTPDSSRQRREPRLNKMSLVQVSRFDAEGFRDDLTPGRTLDISAGGIRLELHHPLPMGSLVDVSLALDNVILDVSGEVVYVEHQSEDLCTMGISFRDLPEESKEKIETFLTKNPPGDQSGELS